MTLLTKRLADAVEYARVAHGDQVRTGSDIPYLYHLLAVSSLVLEYGGSEEQAIAGLLHDAVEDGGAHHEAAIRKRFGEAVADIVMDCTDGTAEGRRSTSWWTRRRSSDFRPIWLPREMRSLPTCGNAATPPRI